MKKNYINHIGGAIFILIGLALLIVSIGHWSQFINGVDNATFLLVGEILFLVVGIALIIIGTINNKHREKYQRAKENGASSEEIFILEEKRKAISRKTVLIMCCPIPFLLLAGFIYLLISTKSTASTSALILCYVAIGFLAFVCVGLSVAFFQSLIRKNHKTPLHIKGELKKIMLANNISTENNTIFLKEYRLLIGYVYKNENCELITQETYSEDQIKLIKQFVYLPLIIQNNEVKIDRKTLFNTPKDLFNQSDAKFQHGSVALYGSEKVGEKNAKKSVKQITENSNTIKNREKFSNVVSIILSVFACAFCAVFLGLALFAAFVDGSAATIIFAIMCALFVALILKKVIYDSIFRNLISKKVQKFGSSSIALSYEFKRNYNDDPSLNHCLIVFEFSDDLGKVRKTSCYIRVSPYYFSTYKVEKLPIIVWKKYAIVDYDKLLEYQNRLSEY